MTSGASQSSVLEQLLAVTYLNDLPAYLDSDAYLYADDANLFEEIACEADRMKLRSSLLKAEEWSNDWLLQYNKIAMRYLYGIMLTVSYISWLRRTQKFNSI